METEKPESAPAGEEASLDTLLLMLGTAAMIHLGAARDPAKGEARPDLAQAKHAIDLLDVLKVKTAGNLTAAESTMLDGLLFDLHTRYLDAVKRG